MFAQNLKVNDQGSSSLGHCMPVQDCMRTCRARESRGLKYHCATVPEMTNVRICTPGAQH